MERDFLLWRYLQIKVTRDIFNSCISTKNDSKFYNIHLISLYKFQGSQWINFKPVYSTFMFTITTGDMFQQKSHVYDDDKWLLSNIRIQDHGHGQATNFTTLLTRISWQFCPPPGYPFWHIFPASQLNDPVLVEMCPKISPTVTWGIPLYSQLLEQSIFQTSGSPPHNTHPVICK